MMHQKALKEQAFDTQIQLNIFKLFCLIPEDNSYFTVPSFGCNEFAPLAASVRQIHSQIILIQSPFTNFLLYKVLMLFSFF